MGPSQKLIVPPLLSTRSRRPHHLLFDLARTLASAKPVEDSKSASSIGSKRKALNLPDRRQSGPTGAFAVSESKVETVRQYIATTRTHPNMLSGRYIEVPQASSNDSTNAMSGMIAPSRPGHVCSQAPPTELITPASVLAWSPTAPNGAHHASPGERPGFPTQPYFDTP